MSTERPYGSGAEGDWQVNLLEAVAGATAAGAGAEALFQPLAKRLCERAGADLVLFLSSTPGAPSYQHLAVFPPQFAAHFAPEPLSLGDPWLAAAREAGSWLCSDTSTATGELGRLLASLGMRAAVVASASPDGQRAFFVVAASSQALLPKLPAEVQAAGQVLRAVLSRLTPSSAPGPEKEAACERLAVAAQMVDALAHSFNNALAAILGQCELLLEDLPEGPRRERVRRIMHRAAQLMSLTRALEEYFGGETTAPLEPADLGAVATAAIELTRCVWETEAQVRGCHIDLQCQVEGPLPIRAAPSQLRRALVHLLFNAIQALGQRGGTITVHVFRQADCAVCQVEDNGVGMTPEVLRRAREPFFTTRPHAGRGLGLTLADAIVRRHGGDLELRSAPGEGTTVTVYLPLAAEG
jgi:signal transduction histidine kinase